MQDLRDLAPRVLDDAAECLPGYFHPGGRIFLVQALHISQPQRLELVQRQRKPLQAAHGHTDRPEHVGAGLPGNPAAIGGSGHVLFGVV
jgi:hypothetical protein